jgi:putative tryptophan/tyrosine transport system substrate-binding protein
MSRRAILLAGAFIVLAGASARALGQTRMLRRIGFLHAGSAQANSMTFGVFAGTLKELGYAEGRDIVVEARWAEGKLDRLPALAADLVALRPEVIVTATSAALAACAKATRTIPIVFATASTPVEQGFVASLSRPGGNVTGVLLHTSELAAKNAEIAREAFPGARRLAILVHESDPSHRIVLEGFLPAAQRFKFETLVMRVSQAAQLEHIFGDLVAQNADALYLPEQNFMITNRERLIALALKARLAVLSNNDDITADGGLMSYGTAREENYRRAAAMVDKILRGARPADLPVEQPERFQLILNQRTARAIGIQLPPVTVRRADRIIH